MLVLQVLVPLLQIINVLGLAHQLLIVIRNFNVQLFVLGRNLSEPRDQVVNLNVLLDEFFLKCLKLVYALIQLINCLVLLLYRRVFFVYYFANFNFFVELLLDDHVFLFYAFLQSFYLHIQLSLARHLHLVFPVGPERLLFLLNISPFSLCDNFFSAFKFGSVLKNIPLGMVLLHEMIVIFFLVLILQSFI